MKVIIFFTLIASAYSGVIQGNAIAAQPVAYGAPAAVHAAPAVAVAPQQYSHTIQAAAIRNVETVGVTKTITPVVTKTTTTRHHTEPAVSLGYVQGYTQSAAGAPQVVPVQYNTQYTQYLNPTVGLNGPVTYAGPAVQTGVAVAAQPVAYAAPAYAAPAYAAPAYAAPAYATYAAPALAHAPVAAVQSAGLYSVQPAYAALSVQPAVAAAAPVAVKYSAPAIAANKY